MMFKFNLEVYQKVNWIGMDLVLSVIQPDNILMGYTASLEVLCDGYNLNRVLSGQSLWFKIECLIVPDVNCGIK